MKERIGPPKSAFNSNIFGQKIGVFFGATGFSKIIMVL